MVPMIVRTFWATVSLPAPGKSCSIQLGSSIICASAVRSHLTCIIAPLRQCLGDLSLRRESAAVGLLYSLANLCDLPGLFAQVAPECLLSQK